MTLSIKERDQEVSEDAKFHPEYFQCVCVQKTQWDYLLMSFTPSLPLHYSALGASTGALAHHIYFISERPLYDFN